jgi:transposase
MRGTGWCWSSIKPAGTPPRTSSCLRGCTWPSCPRPRLPPASPELQPAERLWGLVDEPVANRTFTDLDDLEATLVTRCRALEQQRQPIKARTRYHWWPQERRRKRQ